MKTQLIIIFLAVITLVGFKRFTNPAYLTGHITKNTQDSTFELGGLSVTIKCGNKILATTITDSKGSFSATIAPATKDPIDFFCSGRETDTVLIASLQTFDSDTPDITFPFPAEPKKNALKQTLCPKCNTADKVYKIRYGDALPTSTRKVAKNGSITYSPIVNGHYNAGSCIAGIATYYCNRDKIRF